MSISYNLRRALAAASFVLAALPGLAAAQQAVSGVYLAGELGMVFDQKSELKGTGIDNSLKPDFGEAALGSVGYRFPSGIRVEGELGYRRNEISKTDGNTGSGHVGAASFMGNLLYDVPLESSIVPYFGAGAGGVNIAYGSVAPIGSSTVSDSDTVFGYQGIAGLAVNIDPNLQIFADYHYLRTLSGDFLTRASNQVTGPYQVQTVGLGVRYNFGSPEPAAVKHESAESLLGRTAAAEPAPAPAPATAQPLTFVVFFDFDKAELTPSGQKVIEQAAIAIRSAQATRIQVIGHTDLAGTERYNFRLSLRRANVVKAELIRLRIPADQINVVARGMTDPAVPTAIGVREPKNRRAEILI